MWAFRLYGVCCDKLLVEIISKNFQNIFFSKILNLKRIAMGKGAYYDPEIHEFEYCSTLYTF